MKKESFSVEVEALALDESYKPKDVDHTHLNENIVLDFASNQIEFFPSLCETIKCVQEKSNKILGEIGKNYKLWPLSMPYEINYDVKPSSVTVEEYEYRLKLMKKYSTSKLLFSGIHFNYNFDEQLVHELFNQQDKISDFQEFKNEVYLKVMKNMLFLSPLITYFNSFSPLVSHDFDGDGLELIGKNRGLEHSVSIRNSLTYGYSNKKDFKMNTDDFEKFLESIGKSIQNGTLISEKEIYSKIRIKSKTRNLFNKDVSYIEIRCIDLNPFSNFIDYKDLVFIQTLLQDSLYGDFMFDEQEVNQNIDTVSLHGLKPNLEVTINARKTSFREYFVDYLRILQTKKYVTDDMKAVIEEKIEILKDPKLHPAYKMRSDIIDNNLTITEYGIKLMKGEL